MAFTQFLTARLFFNCIFDEMVFFNTMKSVLIMSLVTVWVTSEANREAGGVKCDFFLLL